MNKFKRILYLLEFFIAFAPSLLILLLGVIFSPLFVLALFDGQMQNTFYGFVILSGSLGYWGAISLLVITLHPERENTPPKRLKIYLCLGLFASGTVVYSVSSEWHIFSIIFLMPIIATIHLAFIQRSYLFSNVANKAINKD